MTRDLHVYVVDDEPLVIESLGVLLRANGFPVEGFTSPGPLFEQLPAAGLACVLLDLRLGGLSGIDVQEEMRRKGLTLPIVFLSGQGDVPSTARAMRGGALDFLVKPVDEPELLDALTRARAKALTQWEEQHARRDATERLARLSRREREVCGLIVRGLLNKQIAFELGASENTVKVHRARVMHKLGVDSVAALVQLVAGHRPPSSSS
jgi:FixJ family two-component response regulator